MEALLTACAVHVFHVVLHPVGAARTVHIWPSLYPTGWVDSYVEVSIIVSRGGCFTLIDDYICIQSLDFITLVLVVEHMSECLFVTL